MPFCDKVLAHGMKIGLNNNSGGRKARKLTRAFALVEVLVAGAILGFSVVTLYSAFSFGFSLIRVSQETVRADQILVQKLETLRLYNWTQTNPSGGIIPQTFTNSFAPNTASPGVTYNGTISIYAAPLTESYSNSLRRVTVSVNWPSGKVTRTRTMSTLISQYGIQAYKQ